MTHTVAAYSCVWIYIINYTIKCKNHNLNWLTKNNVNCENFIMVWFSFQIVIYHSENDRWLWSAICGTDSIAKCKTNQKCHVSFTYHIAPSTTCVS